MLYVTLDGRRTSLTSQSLNKLIPFEHPRLKLFTTGSHIYFVFLNTSRVCIEVSKRTETFVCLVNNRLQAKVLEGQTGLQEFSQ